MYSHLNSEKFIEIKTPRGIVRGMLHKSTKRSVPLIIIVHGYFSSHKMGPARLYVKIARNLVAIGFHVLRFDFTGFGESDGEMKSVTLYSELEDGKAVISHMEKLGYKSGIILLGHSFGSNLSIILADKCKSVKKVICISPVYEKNSECKYLNKDQIRKLDTDAVVARKGFLVNSKFIKALNEAPGFDVETQLSIPVTIIRGTLDEFYTSDSVPIFMRRFPNWHLIEIENAEHNFLDLEVRAKLMRILVNELAEYPNS